MKRAPSVLWILLCHISTSTLLLASCTPKIRPYDDDRRFQSATGVPDYNNLDYWAAHPDKWDPSDSVPRSLRGTNDTREVDVFFVHPTTFTDPDSSAVTNARIDDPYINSKTDYTSILYQASLFNGHARVFAPRYRQAHIAMYYETDTSKMKKAFETAYSDVRNAFIAYLNHHSSDRPIIIASHSQGTTHTKRLLSEFFDGKELQYRLVVAYLAGIKVEKNSYTGLKTCTDGTMTGCLTSWRTYRTDYEGPYTSKSDTSTIVVNPVSWTTDTSTVPRELHKGALLYKFNRYFKSTHSTRIKGDMLWVSKPRFPGSFLYATKNYHAGDFNLFYIDVREDVRRRIQLFKGNRK